MNKRCTKEEALTGFGIIVLILGVIVVLYIALMSRPPGTETGGGVLHAFMGDTGNILRTVGPVTVFSAVNGTPHDVNARYPEPDPGRMGSVELNVALFIGSMGGVDFNKVHVVWISNGIAETLPQNAERPLTCPGWTIVAKYNTIPLKNANSNNILDPGEQFEIFACPKNTTTAYQQFSLVIAPEGNVIPPLVSTSAPPMVQPVMQLM
ncbi:hypothetical protein Mboo_0234 [Methanoregula boonei 6A8]|jgi:hypothetical protein|uniref:Archaeal Type IV pilin N-terminal domain-containing protein n=1 Tax=Methanoregula boonei (strain DSM 21154 / JCM 14090 / 6A8) TaxID=456442 RepID=A7I4U5_METB6|nr:hypothetical protein [Methanoregula boonei]ABS54756.1 hypothetical protein Mboo_0234 [Methanoregula boonei 6A8]